MHIMIKVDSADDISDDYHTMGELYRHRHALFIALMKSNPDISWRANNHPEGEPNMYEGYFVAGMHLPSGDISYHLKSNYWTELDGFGIKTTNVAPKYDGHSSNNVEHRLLKWKPNKESINEQKNS